MNRDWTATTAVASRDDEGLIPAPTVSGELHAVSAEFAAELLKEGPLGAEEQLVTAVLHLRELLEMIPAGDRLSFLFSCWQFWSSKLTPEQRIELGIRGDLNAVEILQAACEVRRTAAVDPAWQRYLDRTRRLTVGRSTAVPAEVATDVSPEGSELPSNYLLFSQAHLTHGQLGLTAEVEALAARTLRCGLSGGVQALDPLATA